MDLLQADVWSRAQQYTDHRVESVSMDLLQADVWSRAQQYKDHRVESVSMREE